MSPSTYEEEFPPLARRYRRIGRAARWCGKSLAGVSRTILVELRWRLGDEIMALPVFESLRAKYPTDRIVVLSNYPDLFENHPFVDAVNGPPAHPDKYLLLRGAPRKTWRLEHYCRRARVDLPVSRPHLYYADWNAPSLCLLPAGRGPLIAVAAGASWSTKRWQMEKWRALCARILAHGGRVVELGQADEPIGAGVSLMNQTSIREAACVLHCADALVCCDSGLMHLALAANTPVVALFGPTDPDILIRHEPHFHPIRSRKECRAYWNRADKEPEPGVCPWHHACCLDDITEEEVWMGLVDLLPALVSSAEEG